MGLFGIVEAGAAGLDALGRSSASRGPVRSPAWPDALRAIQDGGDFIACTMRPDRDAGPVPHDARPPPDASTMGRIRGRSPCNSIQFRVLRLQLLHQGGAGFLIRQRACHSASSTSSLQAHPPARRPRAILARSSRIAVNHGFFRGPSVAFKFRFRRSSSSATFAAADIASRRVGNVIAGGFVATDDLQLGGQRLNPAC